MMSIKFGRRLALASLSLGLLSVAAHADGDPFLGTYAYWQGHIEFDGPYAPGGEQYNVAYPPSTTYTDPTPMPPEGTLVTHFAFAGPIVNPNWDPLDIWSPTTITGYRPNGGGSPGGVAWIEGMTSSSGASGPWGSFQTSGCANATKFRCYYTWIHPNRLPTAHEMPHSINVGSTFGLLNSCEVLGSINPYSRALTSANGSLGFFEGPLIHAANKHIRRTAAGTNIVWDDTYPSGVGAYMQNFVPTSTQTSTRIEGPWMSVGIGSSLNFYGQAIGGAHVIAGITFALSPNEPTLDPGSGGGGPGGGGPPGGGGGPGGGGPPGGG
jgi:hypothetical protein